MKTNRSGMALVEILVSITLLAIISASILVVIAHGAEQVRRVRYVTYDNFAAVHDVELQIREVLTIMEDTGFVSGTEALNSADLSDPVLLWGGNAGGVNLFGNLFTHVEPFPDPSNPVFSSLSAPVQAYIVYSGNNIRTLVGQRAPRYAFPSVSNLHISFLNNTSDLDGSPDLARYITYFNGVLQAGFRFDTPPVFHKIHPPCPCNGVTIPCPHNCNGVNIWGGVTYQWFVSTPGFTTLIPPGGSQTIDELDHHRGRIPMFPEDFIPINAASIESLSPAQIRREFAGMFITLVATPYSNLGRRGLPVASNQLHILGIPVTEGLTSHSNAGMIDRNASNVIVGSDYVRVGTWNDFRDTQPIVAGHSNQNQWPTLGFHYNSSAADADDWYGFSYIHLGNHGMTAPRTGNAGVDGLTVFIVARQTGDRGNSLNANTLITSSISDNFNNNDVRWSLGFDQFALNNSVNINLPGAVHQANEFYVVAGRIGPCAIDPSRLRIRHNLNNIVSELPQIPRPANMQYHHIQLGGMGGNVNSDIVEVLIFDRELCFNDILDEDEFQLMLEYLMAKYRIS